jgi:hypothetical protein
MQALAKSVSADYMKYLKQETGENRIMKKVDEVTKGWV